MNTSFIHFRQSRLLTFRMNKSLHQYYDIMECMRRVCLVDVLEQTLHRLNGISI